ncbi:MAG: T9SS type A sorting domain-containing protein [Saprospiraceae bacterium]
MTLFAVLFASPKLSFAQYLECSLDVPSVVAQKLIEKQSLIDEFIANLQNEEYSASSFAGVPVRFTVIAGPTSPLFATQTDVANAINYLNQAFASSGLTFFQCGELNEIWDDRIRKNVDFDKHTTSFAYASGTMDVVIKNDGLTSYALIPEQAYLDNNPNWNLVPYEHTNFVKLINQYSLGATFAHETGHHFGLMHTDFHWGTYNAPPDPSANDYPYPPPAPLPPNWWGKELVIRIGDPTKPFPLTNFLVAGDLVGDTPVDCSKFPSIHPGCPRAAQNTDCSFNNQLTYVDYNGDAVNPPPAGLSLGRNFMSGWREECLDHFTPGQINRVKYYSQTERLPKYTSGRCGTFTDRVELEGTGTGLHNVSVRVRHTSNQKCNVTSSRLGDFSGLLHQDDLKTHTYHNGKKNSLAFALDPLKRHYGHTRCEWIRGVNVIDLARISQHILGLAPLANGYRMIAADANKSNTISTFDNAELQKLILGKYWDYLPNHEQPWRYIPEFVPQNYATQFDATPFSLLGGAYLEQGWSYLIPNIGQRGFDGIKIGDVDFSWNATTTECPNEGIIPEEGGGASLAVPATTIDQDDVVALTVKIQNPLQLAAFQLALKIPAAYFDIQHVEPSALANYTNTEHFGLELFDENALTTLWFDTTGGSQQLPGNSPLFTVVVKAKQPIANLQTVLQLDEAILPSLFFSSFGTASIAPVELFIEVETVGEERSRNSLQTSTNSSALRCDPNPAQHAFRVFFENTQQENQGTLTITDLTGRIAYQQNVPITPGQNTWNMDASNQLTSGEYIVSLVVGGSVYTSRMKKI